MALTQWINLQIKVSNGGVARAGFGIPLILSHNAQSHVGWAPGYTHVYGSLADVVSDGFATSSPEYLSAAALFSQSPHPVKILIGRCASAVTMSWALKASLAANNAVYSVQVDGEGVTSTLASYTSDGSATIPEINNGLLIALNAVVGKNYLATFAPLPSFTSHTFTANFSTPALTYTAHGFNTGDGPFELTTSTSLPTGLSLVTDYYIIKLTDNTFLLATSLANALAGTAVTFSDNGTGTQTINADTTLSPNLGLIVTGSAAGNWFSLEPSDVAHMNVSQTTADPGIAADLANIRATDNTWYAILSLYSSKAYVLAVAAYAEANSKEYVADVNDTDAISTALTNGDTGDALVGHGYTHTALQYHHSPKEFLSAAGLGRVLPLNPGLWVYAFKTLVGPTPSNLNPTQRQHLIDRRMGAYTFEADRSITWDGKVGSVVYGFLDVAVSLDWFADDVVKAIAGVLFSNDIVEMTDEGIAKIAAAVRGSIARATSDEHKVFDPGDPTDPSNLPPNVVFPKVSDIDPSQRALRQLPDGVITARGQGAIQGVGIIATIVF